MKTRNWRRRAALGVMAASALLAAPAAWAQTEDATPNANPNVPPKNDEPAGAKVIKRLSFKTREDTTAATFGTDEPAFTCGGGGGQTVWFAYTAAVDQPVEADTIGSFLFDKSGNYDTVIQVWTFDGFNWINVVCNDDASAPIDPNNSNVSQVFFNATAGTTYYFQIGSFSGGVYAAPRLSFHVTEQLPPP
jgi:hypothetical protein